jgi:hypothetical protein
MLWPAIALDITGRLCRGLLSRTRRRDRLRPKGDAAATVPAPGGGDESGDPDGLADGHPAGLTGNLDPPDLRGLGPEGDDIDPVDRFAVGVGTR